MPIGPQMSAASMLGPAMSARTRDMAYAVQLPGPGNTSMRLAILSPRRRGVGSKML